MSTSQSHANSTLPRLYPEPNRLTFVTTLSEEHQTIQITINNVHDRPVVYRLRRNKNSEAFSTYEASPAIGILRGKSFLRVKIKQTRITTPQKDVKEKNKLQIMSYYIDESDVNRPPSEVWEKKYKCTYDSPVGFWDLAVVLMWPREPAFACDSKYAREGETVTFSELTSDSSNKSQHIGSGGFARVIKGVVRIKRGGNQGIEVIEVAAVKQITGDSWKVPADKLDAASIQKKQDEINKSFLRELHIMRVKHKNIAMVYGVLSDECPRIVSKFYSNGTAVKYVQVMQSSMEARLQLIRQVGDALEYLHQYEDSDNKTSLFHGDLSGNNILVGDNNEAVLIDFGLSGFEPVTIIAEKETTSYNRKAGWNFKAPELYTGLHTHKSKSTDAFSFGGVALMLATGLEPFLEFKNPKLQVRRGEAFQNYIIEMEGKCVPKRELYNRVLSWESGLWSIVEGCWRCHADRITISKALEGLSNDGLLKEAWPPAVSEDGVWGAVAETNDDGSDSIPEADHLGP